MKLLKKKTYFQQLTFLFNESQTTLCSFLYSKKKKKAVTDDDAGEISSELPTVFRVSSGCSESLIF